MEMLYKETGRIYIAQRGILPIIIKLHKTLILINVWHFIDLMPNCDIVMVLQEAENFVYLTVY